jgi:NADPH:quinone reductase
MRALRADPGRGVLAVAEIARPGPAPGEVLVEVAYAGLSFADWLRSQGRYQETSRGALTVGGELSGRVLAAPAGSPLTPGDRVAAVVGTGAAADFAVVPAESALPVPDGLSDRVAAAAVLNFLTARFALLDRARLGAGQDVVVLGAGGGLGGAAVALARHAGASSVTAVAGSDAKRAAALGMGADRVIGPDELAASPPEADVLFDPVGGAAALAAIRGLREGGRHVVVGFAGGEITAVRLNRALYRNIDHVGAGWGAHAAAHPSAVRTSWAALAPELASGRLAPHIGAEGTLEESPGLLAALGARSVVGKAVVRVED